MLSPVFINFSLVDLHSSGNPPKRLHLKPWAKRLTGPAIWAIVGFCVYYYYSQFVVTVGWNAVELIIAQHILDHGTYVTGLDYPSAITWRPIFPTAIVTLVRLFRTDPIAIYQIVCGLALGTFASSLFLAAERVWGRFAGHLAAFLALTCPAITTNLIDHTHSYSHLGLLVALGPSFAVSISILCDVGAGRRPSSARFVFAGFAWAMAYLSRSEMLLFFAIFVAAIFLVQLRNKASLRPSFVMLLIFAVPFLIYNGYADHVAKKDGLLIRKTIYGFYTSQGWADPEDLVGGDIEAKGYLYAIRLYGDPLSNNESVIRAIEHNPQAFARRLHLNFTHFYDKFLEPSFFLLWCTVALMLLPIALIFGKIPRGNFYIIAFLTTLFGASHFILIFHIDPRYLTIAIAPLLLLITGSVTYVRRVIETMIPSSGKWVPAVFAIAIVVFSIRPFQEIINHRPRNVVSMAAMNTLARYFLDATHAPKLARNREPHLALLLPAVSPLYGEDQFLIPYFTHTAWVNGGANGLFPRGKMYSYTECEPDYVFVPADRMNDQLVVGGRRPVGEITVPDVGRFTLMRNMDWRLRDIQ